ncbi:MAG: NRDE family protein [Actinocatenispora sp.]
MSLEPGRPDAVALIAVRDEFLGRPWDGPDRHWPERPGLIGGRDRLAGGTWLAVDPVAGRAGCVLNAAGQSAPTSHRRSRGELPLAAAAGGPTPADLTPFDPFHLVTVEPTGVRVLTWNGLGAHRYELGAGTHLFVNQGRWTGPGDRRAPRAAYFGPRFLAGRPRVGADVPAERAWGPWLDLVDGARPEQDDPRALVMHAEVTGRDWGTSSITLLSFGAEGPVRYDFRAGPDRGPWRSVPLS